MLGASAGILATVFVSLSVTKGVIITLRTWLIILGILVFIVGVKQSNAAHRLAGSGAGNGGGDP